MGNHTGLETNSTQKEGQPLLDIECNKVDLFKFIVQSVVQDITWQTSPLRPDSPVFLAVNGFVVLLVVLCWSGSVRDLPSLLEKIIAVRVWSCGHRWCIDDSQDCKQQVGEWSLCMLFWVVVLFEF